VENPATPTTEKEALAKAGAFTVLKRAELTRASYKTVKVGMKCLLLFHEAKHYERLIEFLKSHLI